MNLSKATGLVGLAVASTGCKIPPPAPEDFDNLNSYLYQYVDNDPEALKLGMNNLETWMLDNHLEVQEGYVINNLSVDAIHTVIPSYTPDVALIGVAISTDLDNPPIHVARNFYEEDPKSTNPNKVFLSDSACFIAQECASTSYRETLDNDFPLGIVVTTTLISQAEWVETEHGTALVQRRWFDAPAQVNVGWFELLYEFAFEVAIPLEDGGTRRVSSSWIVAQLWDSPVPEDILIWLGIDVLRDTHADLDSWIDRFYDE